MLVANAAPVGGIGVSGAWSRATPPGSTVGAAYFALDNRGPTDRLVRASSPVAERVELHITKTQNNVTTMEHTKDVEVASGATVQFSPGGRHVMLIGLKQPLREGDTFPLTLTFEKAGPIEVTVRVAGLASTPPPLH